MERVKRCSPGAPWCAICFFALCAALGGAEAVAAADPVQIAYRGGSAVLAADARGAFVEFTGERVLPLSLPQGAELTALAEVDGGWVAAGVRPAEEGGKELLMMAGDEEAARPLAAPRRRAPLVHDPVPLVDGGRLAGLAWLEGDGVRSLAVWVSVRAGDGAWRRPRRVAAPGPGSQLALSGAVLADGSWLLVWSAFDGTDVEIVWSRRLGGSWEAPARVSADNAVPDITPALTVTGDGALLAWSRYHDGHYLLMLARFADGGWHDERRVAEPGALYPAVVAGAGRPRLVYRAAAAGAWAVDEVAADGALVRRSEIVTSRSERPVVVDGEPAAARLRWPARRAAGDDR
jgi:hypothetical protein